VDRAAARQEQGAAGRRAPPQGEAEQARAAGAGDDDLHSQDKVARGEALPFRDRPEGSGYTRRPTPT
jgi:hypothetical protein